MITAEGSRGSVALSHYQLETVWKFGGWAGPFPGSLRAARRMLDGAVIRWAVPRPKPRTPVTDTTWAPLVTTCPRQRESASPREHRARVSACPVNGPPVGPVAPEALVSLSP